MLAKHILGYIPSFVIPALTSFCGVYVYTRLLTPQEYGHYALTVNSMTLLIAVFYYWLQSSIPRLMPQALKQGTGQKLRVVAYVAFIVASAVLLLLWALLIRCKPLSYLGNLAWLAYLITVMRALLNLNETFHRSDLNFRRYNLIECGQALIGLCMGIALVYFARAGATGTIIGIIFGMVCMALVDLPQWLSASFRQFDPKLLKEIIHFGMPLVISFGMAVIISTSDRFLIEYFHGADQVGLYAAGYTLTDRIISITFLMIAVPSLPLTVHRMENEGIEGARDQTYRNGVAMLAIGLPACAGLILANRQLAHAFIGEAFREGAQAVMPLIAISSLLNGISSHYFDHAFHLGKRTRLFAVTMGPSALLNLTLNLLLIPTYGYIGAAWSTLASYALMITLSAIIGRKAFPIHFPFLPALQIAGAVVLMVLVLRLVSFPVSFAGLIGMVALGSVTYALGILLFNVMEARAKIRYFFMAVPKS
jgi:O-antigen/teichoic acid export membrane protein